MSIALRTHLRAGDLGSVIRLHGLVYAEEEGFDETFEAYVAGPLSQFALGQAAHSERERLWLAEDEEGRIVGCVAIVAGTGAGAGASASAGAAQLRWYLVDPSARGEGLGRRLLHEAIAFARQAGYGCIVLWTVRSLAAAAHLYVSAGFRKVEEKPGCRWGVDVIEEQYRLDL
jgi:GNAT superfamily N-acetyltransferase